ncbi:class II aldolase/adducin family protein [Acinetobacter radioresistens]|uniref:class II aldolase/adducin family protein n=1 Tax=Acinetobacter radioresistens TaxID=40216 RepID=UPI0020052EDB|nr:class II aldolase/adducin family protein [Acinetobacter radioresistens]MCK4100737.1 class II aldolase/adducin family protein [Acinetobacter radioresistens]
MSLQDKMSASEWEARCQLAALYRLIAYYRMTDLIDTHISLRVPDQPEYFLINQYGVTFDKMTASQLVKIDHDGNIVSDYDQGKPVNVAGFVIHSALHTAHTHINCVIHTHTADGIAVSAQKHGLLPISQHALKFYNLMSYHEYEGVALSTDERERLVHDLGQNRVMILRNHGLLSAGETIQRAFHEIYFLERACQAQIKALAGGSELHYPTPEVCERTARQFNSPAVEPIILNAWNAALSLIENQKAEYCS